MIAISSFISLLSKTQLVLTCVLIPEATPFLLHGLLGSYLICWYVKALREEDTNTTLIKGSKDDGMGCDVMMPNNLKPLLTLLLHHSTRLTLAIRSLFL
jgi:hypothetical protein